jgi:hypothetical protein
MQLALKLFHGSSRNIKPALLPCAFLFAAAILPLSAQCIVDNPGGSKVNIYRPPDANVPEAKFSPLSALNKSLPQWLCLATGYRVRFEGYSGGNFQANNSDSYLLTRFRFGVLISPTSWFKVYAELQDATAWGKDQPLAPPYQSTWDLRRAYLDLGNIEQDRLSLRIGRQDLNFGAGRLVGTSYWRNASKGFDAAEMNLNWNWLRVTVFAASPVIALDNGLSHHQEGNNLYGIYGALKHLLPRSVIEPYLLWRVSPGMKTEGGKLSHLDEKTVGVRWAGNVSRWDYDAEGAGQIGNIGTDRIRSWAATSVVGYTLEPVRLRPRLFSEYSFASGDENPKDGRHATFDQLYPNLHDHHGLADQVAWQNLKEIRTGARISLRRNWMLAGIYNNWWLASATDAFYNSSDTIVARDPRGLSGTHIGEEFDLETSYRFNRQLELGTGIGHLLPGAFLVNTHHNHAYTYPYVMLNYNFF